MYLADTLSHAYLPKAHLCVGSELADVDHALPLALPSDRVQQLQHASADDPVMQELQTIIQQGWPERKSEVPEILLLILIFMMS